MLRTRQILAACATGIAVFATLPGTADDSGRALPRLSVREIMVSIVTPATNIMWGAGNPQDDDAWKALADASAVVIAAGTLVKEGGAGAENDVRSREPEWQANADTMLEAAGDALAAARAKDIDAFVTATDVMYPPCEKCHLQFMPGAE